MQVSADVEAGSRSAQNNSKTNKATKRLPRQNPAGAGSTVCQETGIEIAAFWYPNESLKSSARRVELYLQHAVPPVTH